MGSRSNGLLDSSSAARAALRKGKGIESHAEWHLGKEQVNPQLAVLILNAASAGLRTGQEASMERGSRPGRAATENSRDCYNGLLCWGHRVPDQPGLQP